MSSQGRRLRRKPKYHYADSPIVAALIALGREYHCTVIERNEIEIRHQGRSLKIGTIDEIKGMTLRSLVGYYQEITQDWRYEVGSWD